MESIESEKSPESEFPKYENLSEAQKEMLMSQFGIVDAEAFEEIIINGKYIDKEPNPFKNEEIREYLRQTIEWEQ